MPTSPDPLLVGADGDSEPIIRGVRFAAVPRKVGQCEESAESKF